jgi:FAD/FMN-containing dehydrogenase
MYTQPEQKATHEAWIRELAGLLRQRDSGAYVNFLADEGQERVQTAYPGATWERLRSVKQKYDPTNLFRLNQNIPPA